MPLVNRSAKRASVPHTALSWALAPLYVRQLTLLTGLLSRVSTLFRWSRVMLCSPMPHNPG